MDSLEYVCGHYCPDQGPEKADWDPGVDREYIRQRITAGAMYGIFLEGKLAGFGGIHREGSFGMLYVEEDSRRIGAGASLEAYVINRMLEKGWTPYCHIFEDNQASLRLQEKLGLYFASKTFLWMKKSTCK